MLVIARRCLGNVESSSFQSTYRWNEAFPSKNFLEAPLTAPTLGMIQLLLVISAIEYYNGNFVGRIPGDRGFDPLRLSREGIREK